MSLPTDSAARKGIPFATGCIDYFPDALAAVAALSLAANTKHNPGQPLHWSREKSSDHPDCIARHLAERGTYDPDDGFLHDVKLAWRALANLQVVIEKRHGAYRQTAPVPHAVLRVTSTTTGAVRIGPQEVPEFLRRPRHVGFVPPETRDLPGYDAP